MRVIGTQKVSHGVHIDSHTTRTGFVLTNRSPRDSDQSSWLLFCRKAQEAAELSLPKGVAQGLIGAMREIEENIHLHSERPHDGVVGYRGTANEFEFIVADNGIGILDSLRKSARYSNLSDTGRAIQTALADGQSRLLEDNPGRGYGFHDLFVGLANLNGELRFRSGDYALTIDGTSPTLISARLSQKSSIQGFIANVVCRNFKSHSALQ
jgi:hypothetical protein